MHHKFLTTAVTVLSGSLKIFKSILSLIAGIILFSTIAFVVIYFYFARGLPDIRSIEDYKPPVISQVFADDGSEIGEFWTECRIFLPYERIPKRVMQAFVASEDSRFWEHKGVDMRSIVRAFVANLKAGDIKQGGSTITQQITRSILLTSERTMTRKVKEAILATRLERTLDKQQIITLYLNQIFLGNRAYGIAAAARNYFHKTPDRLTLAETALLAGLPSAPALFSPLNRPEDARVRQTHVLNRMLEEDIITEDEMNKALAEKLTIYAAGIDKDRTSPENAYFVEHVRRLVKEKYGDDILYHKGLKIYSTMDPQMQRAAYAAVRHGVEKLDRKQGFRGAIEHLDPADIPARAREFANEILAKQDEGKVIWPPEKGQKQMNEISFKPDEMYKAIITAFRDNATLITVGDQNTVISRPDPKNDRAFNIDTYKKNLKVGDVVWVRRTEGGDFVLAQLPLVQSALFSMDPHTAGVRAMIGGYDFALSEFNRATQALRQPGSSFKPFIYSAALDKGYTYNTSINDAPMNLVVGRGQTWSPKNYGGGYKGPTPFRNALVFSRNVPTVKIVADIGPHYLTAYTRKFGMTSQIDKYLSMALGANAVYLSEMVQGMVVFLNEGVYKAPIYYTKIEDAKGNVVEENRSETAVAEEEKNDEFISKPRSPGEIVIREDLFEAGRFWIDKDKLVLNDLELKTLYGNEIPPGHVITPQTAYLMVNLLKAVVDGGTGTRVKPLGKPAAGKTGTTNDETDTWFNGFTADLAAGVWVGFDEIKRLGPGETGGHTAAPIFLEYMLEATKNMEKRDFTPPKGFPVGRMATLTGGSAILGSRLGLEEFADRGGADRAGEFFEEDLESSRGYEAPERPYERPAARSESFDESGGY